MFTTAVGVQWPLVAWIALFAAGCGAMYAFRMSNSERDLHKLGKLPGAKVRAVLPFFVLSL